MRDLKDFYLELHGINQLIDSLNGSQELPEFVRESLEKISCWTPYKVHCWLRDFAVSASGEVTELPLGDFIQLYTQGSNIQLEPIRVDLEPNGFLIIELNDEETLTEQKGRHIQTLADCFAIMYKNKLSFENYRNWHAQLNAVLESMSDGIVLVDKNKKIVYQNEAIGYMFQDDIHGRLKDEQQLMMLLQKISEPDSSQIAELAIEENISLKIKVEIKEKVKHYQINKFSVYAETVFIGNGYAFRDITKDQEIDQIKSNLISIASHEFKTPITSIRGSVETLMRSDTTWDEAFKKELLQGIHEDILQLQELISVWMDVKKIEMGTLLLHKDFFPLFHLVKGAIKQLPPDVVEGSAIEFEYDPAQNFPLIYGDEIRLQQVLVNLIMNGIIYNASKQKRIIITVNADEQNIYIRVADNGIGISEKHRKKIFDRFFRVDISATRKTGGTGLGLAICQGLIKEHHGDILVESELGKGSVFTVQLPIIQVS